MSTNAENTSDDNSMIATIARPIVRVLLAVRRSLIVFIAVLGIVMFVTGWILSEGAVAGMLAALGISALIYSGLGFVFVRLIGYT